MLEKKLLKGCHRSREAFLLNWGKLFNDFGKGEENQKKERKNFSNAIEEGKLFYLIGEVFSFFFLLNWEK